MAPILEHEDTRISAPPRAQSVASTQRLVHACTGLSPRGALIVTIKSQPQYLPCQWDSEGRAHLLTADVHGLERARALLGSAPEPLSVLLLVSDQQASRLDGLTLPRDFVRIADATDFDACLRERLAGARMGLRLYALGAEGFVWRQAATARAFGLGTDEMHLERCGTLARRVWCVHCASFSEHVHTNVTRCPGCGRTLLVRDHFSRHHAAYMGFQIDAEVPGEVPPVAEVYP